MLTYHSEILILTRIRYIYRLPCDIFQGCWLLFDFCIGQSRLCTWNSQRWNRSGRRSFLPVWRYRYLTATAGWELNVQRLWVWVDLPTPVSEQMRGTSYCSSRYILPPEGGTQKNSDRALPSFPFNFLFLNHLVILRYAFINWKLRQGSYLYSEFALDNQYTTNIQITVLGVY